MSIHHPSPIISSAMVGSPPSPCDEQLYDIEQPHHNDVLCGRGVTTNRHPGNESFRSLVGLNKELYVTSTKRQKMSISRSIVEAVRSMNPAGRFLEKNPATGLWSDIGDRKAIEKTSQALRDGAASLRKQLSADLGDPDFLSAVFDMDTTDEAESKDGKKSVNNKSAATAKSKAKNGSGVGGGGESPKNDEKEMAHLSSPKDSTGRSSFTLKDKTKHVKAKPIKKGHRRTKSNPDAVTGAKKRSMVKRMKSPTSSPAQNNTPPPPPQIVRSQPASPMTADISRRMSASDRSPNPDAPTSYHHQPPSPRFRAFHESIGPDMFPRAHSFESSSWHAPPSPGWPHPHPHAPPGSPRRHSGHHHHHHHPVPRHYLSPTGYEYPQQQQQQRPPLSPVTRNWTSRSFSFGQGATTTSPRSLSVSPSIAWRSPVTLARYSNGELSVPALTRERSTPSPSLSLERPMSPSSPPSPGSRYHRMSPSRAIMEPPRDFAPPPLTMSPRRTFGNGSVGKAPKRDSCASSVSTTSTSKENSSSSSSSSSPSHRRQQQQQHRQINVTSGGPGSPTVVLSSTVEDDARMDRNNCYKPEVEVISSSAGVVGSSDDFPRDAANTPGCPKGDDVDPARDDDRDSDDDDDRAMSPLPFDGDDGPDGLMDISEDLLQLPIAPCGPHDGGSSGPSGGSAAASSTGAGLQ